MEAPSRRRYWPDRAQVHHPRLLRALIEDSSRRGAQPGPHRGTEGLAIEGGPITTARTNEGGIPCGRVIVAAGAWSGGLLEPAGVRAPTPPLKGQIVLLKSDRPLLRPVVDHRNVFLVPRDDGRVLIGATEEVAGFDARPTALAARDLLDEALRLCPDLGRAAVEATWAGLLPESIDTRPHIGTAPGLENLIIASGHKRAGLQLAPATAEPVADLVLGRLPRLDLAPFRTDRSPDPAGDDTFRS